ncbi:MAG: hypothetical protein MJ208_03145 [Bacilli bacterium]|nr:hypothetical protein [Bacilli bacterium]
MPYKDSPLKEVKELLEKLPPNVWIRVYYGNKGRRAETMKPKKMKSKYTLNQLGMTVDQLSTKVNQLSTKVNQLNTKVNQLSTTVNQLSTTVNQLSMTVGKISMTVDKLVTTVDNLAKYVTEGFKQINSRLDYIVQANNLKDLPKNR